MGKNYIRLTDSQITIALENKEEKSFSLPLESSDSLAKIMAGEMTGVKEVNLIFSQRGILYRVVKIPFMPIDDFEKMMELEKGEYLSVDPNDYEIRYKILEKYDENGQYFWDVALAAIKRGALTKLVEILENLSVSISFVDIIPVLHERIFSQIDEPELMILEDDGQYTRICILKNKKIYMVAEFPIDNAQLLQNADYTALINELRGDMDYYSSRNFGKNLAALLLLGNYDREDIKAAISESIPLKIYLPHEGGFASNYIEAPANESLNFIPEEYLLREKARKQKRFMKFAVPALLALLVLPLLFLFASNKNHKEEVELLQAQYESLENKIMMLEPADRELMDVYEQLDAFHDLINNSYKRVANLRNIEKYIPSQIVYTAVSLSTPQAISQTGNEENQENQMKIYERIPRIMQIEGRTRDLEAISKFVYKLNEDPLIEAVSVGNIGWLPEYKMNSFFITVEIKEDGLE